MRGKRTARLGRRMLNAYEHEDADRLAESERNMHAEVGAARGLGLS